MPYHPSETDYQERGNSSLLIVPVSQMMGALSANPELVPLVGLPWLKACFSEYYSQGLPVFHVCLHSPAMTDQYLLNAMSELLRFMSRHSRVDFKCASEIHAYPLSYAKTLVYPYLFAVNRNVLCAALKSVMHAKQ